MHNGAEFIGVYSGLLVSVAPSWALPRVDRGMPTSRRRGTAEAVEAAPEGQPRPGRLGRPELKPHELAGPLPPPRNVAALACAVNFLLLLFNLGFTSADVVARYNPGVWSPFGQVMVLVWGVTFYMAGEATDGCPSCVWWAFALEKCCYVYAWYAWFTTNDVRALMHDAQSVNPDDTALLALTLHAVYGPIDAVFAILFARIGWQSIGHRGPPAGSRERPEKRRLVQ